MESYWDGITDENIYILEDWAWHTNATPYTAPECIVRWLSGKVYGHPRFEDGKRVHTSAVMESKGVFARTLNSTYQLAPLGE